MFRSTVIPRSITTLLIALASLLLLAGCSAAAGSTPQEQAAGGSSGDEGRVLQLPELSAADLDGRPLQVVATTSLIGDIVSQVGGDAIQLTTLIGPGQDPHSYEPGARDLTAVTTADAIFVNGWDLEEGLIDDLHNIAEEAPIIPVSAHITPLPVPSSDLPAPHAVDPHVWFDLKNVEQWVANIEQTLADLDPANAQIYEDNAAAYRTELDALQQYAQKELALIPAERRYLVTNHDSFSYLAGAYDLQILGTVIPGASTLAEPSAQDLAGLAATMEKHGVCTIFTENAVDDSLAQAIAAELQACDQVDILPLQTGSIGAGGSFLIMFRDNVEAITAGLR